MSSFEKLAIEIVDSDPEVVIFSVQPFTIGYNYKGNKKAYNPDLWIRYKDGKEVVVEVKPKNRLQDSKNVAKIEALKEFCKTHDFLYEIWDEDVLKSKANLLLVNSR